MLSTIDPDKLFEGSSVEEIDEVQKLICIEIEKKKEELRTLVGERYRDFIEAADTIKEMKELSLRIIKDVEKINSLMVDLQKNQRTYKPEHRQKESCDSLMDSIAAQISILVELPELIWTEIGVKNFVKATQLYLLGRHIKTGFTADKSLKQFSNQLPVVEQQWSVLSHFSNTILREAENDLKKINLSNQEASMCLATIAILQDTSLVSKFLSLRSDALNSLLVSDGDVKKQILDSCFSIITSLSLLYSLILEPWESGKGLVWKQLHNSLANNQNPINLLQESIKISFLPPVVLHFKIKPLSKNDLEIEKLERVIADWLDNIKQIVSIKGKMLLNKINILHNLNEISVKHKTYCSASDWEQLLTTFNIKNKFDLWDGVFKPLIVSRAKELISIQYDETFRNVIKKIQTSVSEEDVKRSDLDLRWFIWKETSDDLDMSTNNSSLSKGISLKSKGITPKVYEICNAFEQKLDSLYRDLSGLYRPDDILDPDSNELKNHQQAICSSMIQKLIKHIHDIVNKDSINEGDVLILARFLQAVPEICPMLQKCLMLGENKDNAWQILKMFNSESLYCWSIWEKKSLLRFNKYIPEVMKTPATYADLLTSIPQWDMICIEDEEEGSDKQKSKLRVPSAPSLPLQSALQQVMTEIGKAHVPKLIAENIMQKVVPILLDCYNTETQLCQAQSLQSLFDIKYITAQYIPLTNKELNLLCQTKISKLESTIDPIDLEVFSPLIRTNIKAAIVKTQGMFGLKFHSEESTGIKMSDDACILAMSKSSAKTWFPLLPITNPTNRLYQSNKPKVMKVDKHSNETEASKIQSSSSFFYEWFS
ncbi:conserved oligomeric Golgi complex subunit 1 isoform X2 [Cimex lectularius]|uniref:Conserved oligomeric Golgi complex subunit 1 n=1 Tax=Cimex lectularius TaxID=79782 RepID=A0A8I6RPW5_CIMLE|nr:conserved oligomeric Golgi complex subunit 1 isoform X2 [Cimex lectularius]